MFVFKFDCFPNYYDYYAIKEALVRRDRICGSAFLRGLITNEILSAMPDDVHVEKIEGTGRLISKSDGMLSDIYETLEVKMKEKLSPEKRAQITELLSRKFSDTSRESSLQTVKFEDAEWQDNASQFDLMYHYKGL